MKAFFTLLFLALASTSFAQTKVKLTELKNHIGDSVIAEGHVTSIQHLQNAEGSPTFLYVGGAYPNQKLTVVIWGIDRKKFTVLPEEAFKNKNIRITGKVSTDSGKAQLIVTDPSQIIRMGRE